MKLNFCWKKNTFQYQTGESLYLNKIRVGSYGWNSARSKSKSERDNSRNWSGNVTLPQTRQEIYGENPEEIKAKIEHIVEGWFKEVLRS